LRDVRGRKASIASRAKCGDAIRGVSRERRRGLGLHLDEEGISADRDIGSGPIAGRLVIAS
jgi:hypothetical protein